MDIMLDDFAYGLSKRRVTLSTAGVVPAMYRLREVTDVALAVSLHAPTDELRNVLVPLNKKYPLKELMQACENYFKDDNRRYSPWNTFMLPVVNDTTIARKTVNRLTQRYARQVNLIPSILFQQQFTNAPIRQR